MAIEEIEELIAQFAYSVVDYENRTPEDKEQSFLLLSNARKRLTDAIKQYKEQK